MKCQICDGPNGKAIDFGDGIMFTCIECLGAEVKVAAKEMMGSFLKDFFAPLKEDLSNLGKS